MSKKIMLANTTKPDGGICENIFMFSLVAKLLETPERMLFRLWQYI
jgi:hypothetical protein